MGLLRDPCGIICFLITYATLTYADYCVLIHILLPTLSESIWASIHVAIFNTFIFLVIYSHLRASLGDPAEAVAYSSNDTDDTNGCVPLPEVAVDFSEARRSSRKKKGVTNDEWSMCKQCEIYRPPRSHHCRVCKRCIRRMDHHCPWINNCVGEQNLKFFLLFLFYTGLSSTYALILAVISWSKKCIDCSRSERESRKLHLLVLIIICGFYFLFVITMMCDQLAGIFRDKTAIEKLQNHDNSRPPKSRLALLTDVCGGGAYYKWFLPWSSPRQEKQGLLDDYYDV